VTLMGGEDDHTGILPARFNGGKCNRTCGDKP
jgi:hypothetical protein